MAELVDARDLKSRDSNIVRVRFPLSAQMINIRGVAQMARARGLGP